MTRIFWAFGGGRYICQEGDLTFVVRKLRRRTKASPTRWEWQVYACVKHATVTARGIVDTHDEGRALAESWSARVQAAHDALKGGAS